MENPKQQSQKLYEIICDKVIYQRLQSIEDNESVKLYLFPFKNLVRQTLNFIVLDVEKCKISQNSQLEAFNKQQFVQTCNMMTQNAQRTELLTYSFDKQSISQLQGQQIKEVRIVTFENIKEVNQMLKDCVIVTLKLPTDFYALNNCNFSLQGFKFNPAGKIKQSWSFVNNGRVTKGIFALDNQKIKKQLNENKTYPKTQLRTIIQLIQNVNTLKNTQQKNIKVLEELSLIEQNFIHHEKFIANSNSILPIINFQIEVLCSLGRGESCKNKVTNETLRSFPKVIHNVCLNYGEGFAHCQQLIRRKVQELFTKGQNQTQSQSTLNGLCLTTMPTKLVNPHLFLKTESKQKFSQYYVKGLYEYYHYGDHNFNDQGWGCAYRSLESLLSWFRLQQKLNLFTVPTVPQIQNLIDLIDCTSQQKLSNTNTWIGATEVSWVIKKLTGFDCRILHIKDGKDIVQHAQMFREHLENVGTPIMYGGGEYAYSIVGINYSWKLGEIMFCILDPHYNGSDRIDKIIEKKGICWRKPEEMFKKGVFYNFCLPIL